MSSWQELVSTSVTDGRGLSRHLNCEIPDLDEITSRYPMRINPYFLSLIRSANDPLWKQAVPDLNELNDPVCLADPLAEDELSPVPLLVHKYPDRVLFLVSNQCAMYCRFCTRKRMVGTSKMHVTEESLQNGYDYIRRHPEIREVLLSGGDPLLLADEKIREILDELRSIPSIEIIRIGSRVPSTLPMRITDRLVAILKKYHPLYINTHFNHPDEITPLAAEACRRLADAGIPLGSQTVLLRVSMTIL